MRSGSGYGEVECRGFRNDQCFTDTNVRSAGEACPNNRTAQVVGPAEPSRLVGLPRVALFRNSLGLAARVASLLCLVNGLGLLDDFAANIGPASVGAWCRHFVFIFERQIPICSIRAAVPDSGMVLRFTDHIPLEPRA